MLEIQQPTKYQCELCNNLYDTKQESIDCEKAGNKLKEWETTLKPFMWYKFYREWNKEVIYIFCSIIKFNYHTTRYTACCKKAISLHSTYYNNYFNVYHDTLISIYSLEEAFEKYGLLPKFGSVSFNNLNNDIKDRINDIYKKRNEELKTKISNMSQPELINRLFEEYKFEPNRYELHSKDNIKEPNDLFKIEYNIF